VGQHHGSDGGTRRRLAVRVRRLLLACAALMATTAKHARAAPPQMLGADEDSATDHAALTVPRFSIGAGANRYLLVGVDLVGAGAAVSSISWEGQTLAAIGVAAAGGGCRAELWGLTDPVAGNHLLTVTLNQTASLVVGLVAFAGVDQINPTGTFAQATGSNSSVSLTIPGIASSFMVASTCLGGNWPASVSGVPSGQTTAGNPLWDSTQQDVVGLGAGRLAGGTASNVSWSIAGNGKSFVWGAGGVALNPVGTAPDPPDAASSPDAATPDAAADRGPADASTPAVDARPGSADSSSAADARPAPDLLAPPRDAMVTPQGDDGEMGAPDSSGADGPDDAENARADSAAGPDGGVTGAGPDGGVTVVNTRLAVGCACRAAGAGDSGNPPLVLLIPLLLMVRRSWRR
jgi:hypothetical protein